MVEGTRFKEVDQRLGAHESRLDVLNETASKTRTEFNQQFTDMNLKMDQRMEGFGVRLDKMDNNFLELKQLIMGMQNPQKGVRTLGGVEDTREEGPSIESTPPLEVNQNPPSPFVSQMLTSPLAIATTPPVYTTLGHNNHTQGFIPTPPTFYQPNHTNLNLHSTPASMNTYTQAPPYTTTTTTIPTTTPINPVFVPPFNAFTYPHHSQNPQFTGFASPHSPHTYMPQHNFHVNPKIEFPKFDGQDPKGWVSRAEQYFEFIPVEDLRKMKLAGLHFEGKANTWFRYYQTSKGSVN